MHRTGLQALVETLEQDRRLDEPERLHERLAALDRLDAYLPTDGFDQAEADTFGETPLDRRASAILTRFERVNRALYDGIRDAIRQGHGADGLLRWVSRLERDAGPVQGEAYDGLDELVGGVLRFDQPREADTELAPEMVFYQPTPARHVFDLIARTALGEGDVLVDLGSGLGHVPLLAAICTRAQCIGIELEAAYVECARRCAAALDLGNAAFVRQDARAADFSRGTVFYLYTPFTGTILREVLDALERQAAGRELRVCTYGPCTPVVACEPWLQAQGGWHPDRVAVFRSRRPA